MASARRIAVVGTGAMAMLFGARLARAGHSVTLYGEWAEGLRAIAGDGVRVETEPRAWSAGVSAERLPSAPVETPASLALVLVKSHQSREAGRALARLLDDRGTALTLQNGLGNRETLELEAARPVSVGVTTAAAGVVAPGWVHEVSTGRTVLAAADEPVARLLAAAGFEVATSRDVRSWVWLKLAVNCAINPVSALEGVRNGQLLERSRTRRLLIAAASEVASLAAALGIALPTDPVQEALAVARKTSGNVSSMLRDVRRGAPTEIDALCGEVARRGREAGVATPVNDELWQRVREVEAGAGRRRAVEVGA